MKINIYYGGRGIIEDATIYVINKLTEVLKELRVEVTRYNIYEEKNSINLLPRTLKEADGVILATSVEWMGIGGLMQQFLDECWIYADKEKIKSLYMMPVVLATTYGERDAELTLIKAWELLGGISCAGLCAYVDDYVEFETNPDYVVLIEKKAEYLYRTINQKIKGLPTSGYGVKKNILRSSALLLTPQENDQLSMYTSDDTYVKKQKEDIEELTQIFKDMLGSSGNDENRKYIKELKDNFHPLDGFKANYLISITDTKKNIMIDIENEKLKCNYEYKEDADVIVKTVDAVVNNIITGRTTIQKAFMSGDLTAKGDFNTLRMFDQVFSFSLE